MINGLDIYYSKKVSGSGLKPISQKANGLKPISQKSFWIKTNWKRIV